MINVSDPTVPRRMFGTSQSSSFLADELRGRGVARSIGLQLAANSTAINRNMMVVSRAIEHHSVAVNPARAAPKGNLKPLDWGQDTPVPGP